MWFAKLYINGELIKENYEFNGRYYYRDAHANEFGIAESIENYYEDLTEDQEDKLRDFVDDIGDLDFFRYTTKHYVTGINFNGDKIEVVPLITEYCSDFVLRYFEEFEHEFGDKDKYMYHIFSDYTQVGEYLDGLIFDNLHEIMEDFNKLGLEDYLNQLEYLAEESKKAVEIIEDLTSRIIAVDYLEDIPIPSILVEDIKEDSFYFYDLKDVNTLEDVKYMLQYY